MKSFEKSDMPGELLPEYRGVFRELAKNVSYTVGKPVRGENSVYSVTVKVKPVTLFPDTYGTFQEKAQEYADQVTVSVLNGAEMPREEEMPRGIYQIYYDVRKGQMDAGMLFGEVQETVLHVTKEGGAEFEIDKEDMDKLDSMLIEDAGGE